jgi:hypothetical protein
MIIMWVDQHLGEIARSKVSFQCRTELPREHIRFPGAGIGPGCGDGVNISLLRRRMPWCIIHRLAVTNGNRNQSPMLGERMGEVAITQIVEISEQEVQGGRFFLLLPRNMKPSKEQHRIIWHCPHDLSRAGRWQGKEGTRSLGARIQLVARTPPLRRGRGTLCMRGAVATNHARDAE